MSIALRTFICVIFYGAFSNSYLIVSLNVFNDAEWKRICGDGVMVYFKAPWRKLLKYV